MAKRTTARKRPKTAPKGKGNKVAATPTRSGRRTGSEMSTSVLEGPMKPLIAEAWLRRR